MIEHGGPTLGKLRIASPLSLCKKVSLTVQCKVFNVMTSCFMNICSAVASLQTMDSLHVKTGQMNCSVISGWETVDFYCGVLIQISCVTEQTDCSQCLFSDDAVRRTFWHKLNKKQLIIVKSHLVNRLCWLEHISVDLALRLHCSYSMCGQYQGCECVYEAKNIAQVRLWFASLYLAVNQWSRRSLGWSSLLKPFS